MLIYKIATELHKSDTLLIENGVDINLVVPSRFSFLTSLRISTEIKKREPQAIFVSDIKNALAALSARKLNRTGAIIFFADSRSKIPLSLPDEIATGIDAMVFDGESTKSAWEQVRNIDKVKRTEIINPSSVITDLQDKDSSRTKLNISPTLKILTFAGPLDDVTNLKKTLDKLSQNEKVRDIKVRILGTGKARTIMPLVKRYRATQTDIDWLGEDYELNEELAASDGFILAGKVPTPNEIILLKNHVPAIDHLNLDKWITGEDILSMREEAYDRFVQLHEPQMFVNKIKGLLFDLQ